MYVFPFFSFSASISLYFRGQVDAAAIKTSLNGRPTDNGPFDRCLPTMKNGSGLSPKMRYNRFVGFRMWVVSYRVRCLSMVFDFYEDIVFEFDVNYRYFD